MTNNKTTKALPKKLDDSTQADLDALNQRGDEVLAVELADEGKLAYGVNKDSDHKDLSLVNTFGTKTVASAKSLMSQVTQFTYRRHGELKDNEINMAFALVKGIEPKDDVEGMLAAQMVATHMLAMDVLSSAAAKGEQAKRVELKVNQGTKLTRSFMAQMAALDKHRGKGQQKMTVEHVHVGEGGQAIIGNVEGGKLKNEQ